MYACVYECVYSMCVCICVYECIQYECVLNTLSVCVCMSVCVLHECVCVRCMSMSVYTYVRVCVYTSKLGLNDTRLRERCKNVL